MGLLGLFRRKPHERAGFALYTAAVGAARQPVLFGPDGVPDTLDGRFDLVSLHVALLIARLHRDADPAGPLLAQAVFDAMFADMDINLREMGVSDMVVGKRVRTMWEAFHGRASAYEAAMESGDDATLEAALARNVWRGEPPVGGPARMGVRAKAVRAALLGQPLAALLKGEIGFPPAAVAMTQDAPA